VCRSVGSPVGSEHTHDSHTRNMRAQLHLRWRHRRKLPGRPRPGRPCSAARTCWWRRPPKPRTCADWTRPGTPGSRASAQTAPGAACVLLLIWNPSMLKQRPLSCERCLAPIFVFQFPYSVSLLSPWLGSTFLRPCTLVNSAGEWPCSEGLSVSMYKQLDRPRDASVIVR